MVAHSSLTQPEVSLMVFAGSFRLLVCSFYSETKKIAVLGNENYAQILNNKLHNRRIRSSRCGVPEDPSLLEQCFFKSITGGTPRYVGVIKFVQ